MNDHFIESVIAAYVDLFDPPTRTIRFSRTESLTGKCAVVAYLPNETEQLDPISNMTQLGTVGFGSEAICADFPCELGVVIKGALDESFIDDLAKELAELASAPLKSGILFEDGQILTNVSLSVFPRFSMAMLVDWDSVYGLRFPEPLAEIGLLRVVPLFPSEADFVESYADQKEGYRALVNRGMVEKDPDREPIV